MKGISLIELLVTLSIASLAMTMLLSPTANGFFTNENAFNQRAHAAYNFAVVKNLLQSDLNFLDAARAAPHPFFNDRFPTFSDTSVIPLSTRYRENSQWWAFTKPYFANLLLVEHLSDLSADMSTAVVCGDSLKNVPFVETEGIVLCDTGFQEVFVFPQRSFKRMSPPTTPCWEVNIRKTKNLVVRNDNAWNLSAAVALQLIDEKYFYYTSVKDELRRVQVKNGLVVENQPVLAELKNTLFISVEVSPSLHFLMKDRLNFYSGNLFRSLLPIPPAVLSASVLQANS